MKYTTYNVQQLNRKGKPWQARAKYKDVYGKWKETSKMLPDATGKREAQRMAKEWFEQLNAEATTAYNYLVRNDYVNDNGELTDIYRAVAESGSFPR